MCNRPGFGIHDAAKKNWRFKLRMRINDNSIGVGNESVPIQLAQCWFPALVISNAKI